MLELRPNCECCNRDLPPESPLALICTFECTFCRDCAEHLPGGNCPNCGGNLVPRPIRPVGLLEKHPGSEKRVVKPGCEEKLLAERTGPLTGRAEAFLRALPPREEVTERVDVKLRNLRSGDEQAWRGLWAGYNAFYDATVAPEITSLTWQRILDPDSPLLGRTIETDQGIVGFSLSVTHDGTWVSGKVCYLEDLFVGPAQRGAGFGRLLIQDLVDLAQTRKWSTLYWHTRQDNPARKLYDSFVAADDFVRYRMLFAPAA